MEQSLKVLGYVISDDGLFPDLEKISAVQDFPVPKSVKEVQSFLVVLGHVRTTGSCSLGLLY